MLLLREKEEEKKKNHKCNCKKSRCLKLYCECFANGEYCIDCSCQDCSNTIQNEKEKLEAFNYVKDKNPIALKLLNKSANNKIINNNNVYFNNGINYNIEEQEFKDINHNLISYNHSGHIVNNFPSNILNSSESNNNLNFNLLNQSHHSHSFNSSVLSKNTSLFPIITQSPLNKNSFEEYTLIKKNSNKNFNNGINSSFINNNYNNNNNLRNFKNNQINLGNINSNPNPEQVIGCNCTKSNCTKKYCECFKAGKTCIEACRCRDCDNIDDQKKQMRILRKNKSGNNYNLSIYDDFVIEKISIHIEKSNIYIKESVIWDLREYNKKENLTQSFKNKNKYFYRYQENVNMMNINNNLSNINESNIINFNGNNNNFKNFNNDIQFYEKTYDKCTDIYNKENNLNNFNSVVKEENFGKFHF